MTNPADPSQHARRGARDRALFRRYRATGDPALREALAERFLPLARHLALRHNGGPESLEDLFQVACVGLVKAIERYEPDRDASFASFAVPTIAGELKRHFRDRTWTVHVPRSVQELAVAVRRAEERLADELGRRPTAAELAAATRAPEAAVREALGALDARVPASLDARLAAGDADAGTIGDRLGVEEAGYRVAEHRALLDGLLPRLSDRQRTVLRLRFVDDLTQREIGERLGMSQMQAYRLLRDALDVLQALESERADEVTRRRGSAAA